jgi:hypothetical protein
VSDDLIPRSAIDAANLFDLNSRRKPVVYTVRLRQGYDGSLTVHVEDVADDRRSRAAVADALRQAADLIELTLGRTEGAPAPDGAA